MTPPKQNKTKLETLKEEKRKFKRNIKILERTSLLGRENPQTCTLPNLTHGLQHLFSQSDEVCCSISNYQHADYEQLQDFIRLMAADT
jgi:hypothetical protein